MHPGGSSALRLLLLPLTLLTGWPRTLPTVTLRPRLQQPSPREEELDTGMTQQLAVDNTGDRGNQLDTNSDRSEWSSGDEHQAQDVLIFDDRHHAHDASTLDQSSSSSRCTSTDGTASTSTASLSELLGASVRHAGWVASTLMACVLTAACHCYHPAAISSTSTSTGSNPSLAPSSANTHHVSSVLSSVLAGGFCAGQVGAVAAAWLVALSAIATDLLCLKPHNNKRGDNGASLSSAPPSSLFYCGNLGLLVSGLLTSAVDYTRILKTQVGAHTLKTQVCVPKP